MPSYETLLFEKQRKGVLITMNRPEKLNSIRTLVLVVANTWSVNVKVCLDERSTG